MELPDDEAARPYPVYQRGIYFPNTVGVGLPSLILNTKVTLEFIIRPENFGSVFMVEFPNGD